MDVCLLIESLRERIEVESGREGSVMSRGGLRRDLRVTERERSWPGASFCFLVRGRGILGRMYYSD